MGNPRPAAGRPGRRGARHFGHDRPRVRVRAAHSRGLHRRARWCPRLGRPARGGRHVVTGVRRSRVPGPASHLHGRRPPSYRRLGAPAHSDADPGRQRLVRRTGVRRRRARPARPVRAHQRHARPVPALVPSRTRRAEHQSLDCRLRRPRSGSRRSPVSGRPSPRLVSPRSPPHGNRASHHATCSTGRGPGSDPATALAVNGIKPRSTVYVGPRLLVSRGPQDEGPISALEEVAATLGWRHHGQHQAQTEYRARSHDEDVAPASIGARSSATAKATSSTSLRRPASSGST